MERRDFIRTTCCSAALAALAGTLAGCDSAGPETDVPSTGGDTGITVSGSTITLDLTGSRARQVASPGGFLLITSARTVVLNVGGDIRAFTSVCTHQQCDISSFSDGRMTCPCHGSQFTTTGEVARGPAAAPLTEFAVSRNGDVVTITRS